MSLSETATTVTTMAGLCMYPSQLVSSRSVPKNFSKLCKICSGLDGQISLRIVHCSDTACSQLVYLHKQVQVNKQLWTMQQCTIFGEIWFTSHQGQNKFCTPLCTILGILGHPELASMSSLNDFTTSLLLATYLLPTPNAGPHMGIAWLQWYTLGYTCCALLLLLFK